MEFKVTLPAVESVASVRLMPLPKREFKVMLPLVDVMLPGAVGFPLTL